MTSAMVIICEAFEKNKPIELTSKQICQDEWLHLQPGHLS